jgi:glycosyltransferase involved in cell wall biosynthesis
MNLAVLFFRFGPYHVARLNVVGHRTSLTAIELSGRATEYEWEPVDTPSSFERVTVFPGQSHREVPHYTLEERIAETFSRIEPDVVALPGWDDPGTLTALLWCKARRIPTVVMSASSALDAPRRWWRETIKSQVVQQYDAGLVGGKRHSTYLQNLGMDADRTFTGYNVVDNDHFREGAETARQNADALRRRFDLPKNYFLAIGRFIPKKNFSLLLEAYAAYRKRSPEPWDLVLLGDGPLSASIENQKRALNLEAAVHLPGFKQYQDLPVYYGLADAFVHTSLREQWGLVVNEAMAAGLPVLVSERCGCVPDLVEHGNNGYRFDPENEDVMVDLMVELADASTDREEMGRVSQSIICNWTPDVFGKQLLRAAQRAREHAKSRSKISFMNSALLSLLSRR